MFDSTDNPPSLYKQINLSQIARKFEFPCQFSYPMSTSALQPPGFLLPQSQQLTNCRNQIQQLKKQIFRLSCLPKQLQLLKNDYYIVSDKYEQMLNQNIRIHSLIKNSADRQMQLSQANDKVSSLMRQNQCFHKLKSLQQKQTLRLKTQLQNQQRKRLIQQGQLQIILTEKIQLQQVIDQQRRQKQLLLSKYDQQIKQVKSKIQQNQTKFKGQKHTIQSLENAKYNQQKSINELTLSNQRLQELNKNLQQLIQQKDQQICKLTTGNDTIIKLQQQIKSLIRQIGLRQNIIKDLKNKFQKQSSQISSNFSMKFNTILSQNQQLKKSIQNLHNEHTNSISMIQNLQNELCSYKNNSSKLQMENSKLSTALFTSRAQSEQNKRKNTQLSRISYDADHYRGENQRLKQQLSLIKKKHRQLQNNYSTLLLDMKDKDIQQQPTSCKPRQSTQSRKSTRSSKSKEPRHAQITLINTARTRSSHKSHTELQQLSNVNQYKNVIQSKLLKSSINRNQSLGQNVMKRYKVFFNNNR